MFNPRLRTSFRYRLRRGLTVAAAMSFLCASVGISWIVGPRKDGSIAFPCLYRACGCHDAASCKEHCCCFSDAEKLAWAAEHNVDPAPFVRESKAIESSLGGDQPRLHSPRGELMAGGSARLRSCCSDRKGQAPEALSCTADRNARPAPDSVRLISISAFRQCHGLMTLWSALAHALPVQTTSCYQFDSTSTGTVALLTKSPIRIALSPPTPPPKG